MNRGCPTITDEVCSLVNCSVCIYTYYTSPWEGYQALVWVSGTETIRRMVIPVTWGWLHCFVRDRESCLLTWGGPSWHLGNTCTSPLCTAERALTHQTPGKRKLCHEHQGGKAPTLHIIAQHRHQTGIIPYCPEQKYSWVLIAQARKSMGGCLHGGNGWTIPMVSVNFS